MKKRNWKMDKQHKEEQKQAWFNMLEEIDKEVKKNNDKEKSKS